MCTTFSLYAAQDTISGAAYGGVPTQYLPLLPKTARTDALVDSHALHISQG